MNQKYIVIIAVFLIAAGISSCKKHKPQDRASSAIRTQAGGEDSQVNIYPHSEKFKITKHHGLEFYTNPAACKECHGENLDGGTSAISCNKCHGVFPHSQEFKVQLHGGEFFKDRKTCTQCHGSDLAGGNSTISCRACHSYYPHEPKWTLAKNHGETFVKNKDMCLKCHGETSPFKTKYPDLFLSCDSCHPTMPHEDGFEDYEKHRKLGRTYQGKCTLCHTDLKKHTPNLGEDGCYFCHEEDEIPTVKWIKK